MVLDSLLAGVMLFSSLSVRTPNVQPNPDDYEVSLGVSHKYFHINRQWERELGEFYIDDLFWAKLEGGKIYFKPEYMNKESHDVRYFKMDWRNTWKDFSYGFTSRNDDEDVFSQNFETFFSFGMSKKKTYWKKVDVEVSFDGYMPPDDTGENTTFEYEDKFKISWKLTDKVRLYNVGEVSKLQGKGFYKGKIGIEVSL
jgi:hypothetical protein